MGSFEQAGVVKGGSQERIQRYLQHCGRKRMPTTVLHSAAGACGSASHRHPRAYATRTGARCGQHTRGLNAYGLGLRGGGVCWTTAHDRLHTQTPGTPSFYAGSPLSRALPAGPRRVRAAHPQKLDALGHTRRARGERGEGPPTCTLPRHC